MGRGGKGRFPTRLDLFVAYTCDGGRHARKEHMSMHGSFIGAVQRKTTSLRVTWHKTGGVGWK